MKKLIKLKLTGNYRRGKASRLWMHYLIPQGDRYWLCD
jgi:hypothetical protein